MDLKKGKMFGKKSIKYGFRLWDLSCRFYAAALSLVFIFLGFVGLGMRSLEFRELVFGMKEIPEILVSDPRLEYVLCSIVLSLTAFFIMSIFVFRFSGNGEAVYGCIVTGLLMVILIVFAYSGKIKNILLAYIVCLAYFFAGWMFRIGKGIYRDMRRVWKIYKKERGLIERNYVRKGICRLFRSV